MELKRSSGILLHPTSLPGPHGVGDLGLEARRFVDRLAEAGQSWWQVLPLTPPGHGGSPYSSYSAFAGNPTLIDPDDLLERGLVTSDDLADLDEFANQHDPTEFEVNAVTRLKNELLRRAFQTWKERDDDEWLQLFRARESDWLDDFALFEALKVDHGGRAWTQWPRPLVERDPEALAAARERLADEVLFSEFKQWLFEEQWEALRDYAVARGVRFIGDMPIFVAMDSADVWVHRDLFRVDEDGEPDCVAGVPPDYFSDTGQMWGNPLYRWDVMAENGYAWWISRVERAMETCDLIRIDHFRAFEDYWAIPAHAENAILGEWKRGPADDFFAAIRDALGDVPFIAEDLGDVTPEVYALRDRQELPGMKILQFAFDGDPSNPFLPHNYPRNCVAYTGTHDNDTTAGWWEKADEETRRHVRAYLEVDDDAQIVWDLIVSLWSSRAALTIIPLQDIFELGSEARMNLPATAAGNWRWRMPKEMLATTAAWENLRRITDEEGRAGAARTD